MARVVRRTFGVLKRNFVTFGGSALVLVAVPYTALNWAAPGFNGQGGASMLLFGLAAWFVSLVGGVLLQAAVVHGTISDLNGKRVTLGDGLSTAVRFFFPLLGLALLMMLGYMAGLIALVVPGVIAMIMWAVAAPALVVERKGVFGAMQRSRTLTKGSRWPLFGLGVVYFIAVYAIYFGLAGLKAIVLSAAGGVSLVQAATSAVFSAFTSMIGCAGAAAIYYELRSVKEGVGAGALAAVFD